MPKPRYITGRRREGLEHLDERREGLERLDNFDSKEFEKDIIDAQETHRHILMTQHTATYLNAMALMSPVNPSLRQWKTTKGDPLWVQGDNVHLMPTTFCKQAAAVMAANLEIDDDGASIVTSLDAS